MLANVKFLFDLSSTWSQQPALRRQLENWYRHQGVNCVKKKWSRTKLFYIKFKTFQTATSPSGKLYHLRQKHINRSHDRWIEIWNAKTWEMVSFHQVLIHSIGDDLLEWVGKYFVCYPLPYSSVWSTDGCNLAICYWLIGHYTTWVHLKMTE